MARFIFFSPQLIPSSSIYFRESSRGIKYSGISMKHSLFTHEKQCDISYHTFTLLFRSSLKPISWTTLRRLSANTTFSVYADIVHMQRLSAASSARGRSLICWKENLGQLNHEGRFGRNRVLRNVKEIIVSKHGQMMSCKGCRKDYVR
jgi:hypothetical protein